ncbi:unnamed protein product [Boreogadus saida]
MRRADWGSGVSRITDLMHTRNRRADLEHRRRLELLDAQFRYRWKDPLQRDCTDIGVERESVVDGWLKQPHLAPPSQADGPTLGLAEAAHLWCTMKRLQQREAILRRELERDALLRACEPKATVRRNMREIALLERSGERPWSSKSLAAAAEGARPSETPLETPSEPLPPPPQRPSTVPWLSIRQLREVAAIDSIAAREKAWREQSAREELKRLEDGERREMVALRRRIKAFNDTIGSVGGLGRPASTGSDREGPGPSSVDREGPGRTGTERRRPGTTPDAEYP